MQVLKQREHEELEDAVQHLVALASAPAPFPQDLASMSNEKILQKLGYQSVHSNRAGAVATSTRRDDPTTQILIQRRLNSEYRFAAAKLREEHERLIQSERAKAETKEKNIRDEHLQTLKTIAASSTVSDNIEVPRSKAPSTNAVVVLERQLIERVGLTPSRGSSVPDSQRPATEAAVWDATNVDPATRKLIAFWKARYQTAAKRLEEVSADLSLAEAKCAQQVELRGADVDTVERMIAILQDAEVREKARLASNRSEYLEACRRFGVDPRTDVEDETVAVTFDPATRSFVSSTDKTPPTAGAMLLSTLAREQRNRNDEARAVWEDTQLRIDEMAARCDSLLETLAERTGGSALDGSVHVMEEQITLLSQIDVTQRATYEKRRKHCRQCVEQAASHRQRVEALETRRWTLCEAVERHRSELRALDVKLLTVSGASHGTNEVLDDESSVLQSKISLLENELALLRSERKELEAVGDELDRQVRRRMNSTGNEREALS